MKYFKVLVLTAILFVPCVCMANFCSRKVVDYTIASAFLKESLVEEVERLIKKGWQPYKGVTHNSENGWMYQTMVKYEEDNK